MNIPATIVKNEKEIVLFALGHRYLLTLRDSWTYLWSSVKMWNVIDPLYNASGAYYAGGVVGFVSGYERDGTITDAAFFNSSHAAYEHAATLRRRELDEATA